MKSLLTVSGVVFAHICVFLLLVNGCRGNASGGNDWSKADTSVYSGGARSSGAEGPAVAVPAPAPAEPARATPASASPQPSEEAAPATATLAPDPEKAQERTDAVVYEVKAGEFLSTIAVRYGVTAKDIADASGIALNSTLRVGQKLTVPAPKPKAAGNGGVPAADGEIYVVQKNDILGRIARKYKVSVAAIKQANNLTSDNIRVGQKLVIPSKTERKDEAAKPGNAQENAPAAAEPNAAQPAPAESVPAETEPTGDGNAPAETPAEPAGKWDESFGAPDAGPVPATPEAGAPAESD